MKLHDIIELARFEFRRYGFRADGAALEQFGRPRETVTVEFEREPATGQAAFSQIGVLCYIRLWHQNDGAIDCLDFDIPLEKDRTLLELSVSYDHHGGGSNGISRRYELVKHPFEDAPKLKVCV